MAHNNNGNLLEDPQNWPFAVRYTASPYRKSKFPVDNFPTTTFLSGDPVLTTGVQGYHPHLHHYHQGSPPAIPPPPISFQPSNLSTDHQSWMRQIPYATNANDPRLLQNHHHYHNGLPGSADVVQRTNNNFQNAQSQTHHYHQRHYFQTNGNVPAVECHYGLPTNLGQERSSPQYFNRSNHPRTRSKYPPTYLQHYTKQNQGETLPSPPPLIQSHLRSSSSSSNGIPVVDEGYIEDLLAQSNPNSCGLIGNHLVGENLYNSHIRNLDSNPYSYVYDSNIFGENPPAPEGIGNNVLGSGLFNGPSILERLQREALRNQISMSHSSSNISCSLGGVRTPITNDGNLNLSTTHQNYHKSENEYEEIREVARYMTMGHLETSESIDSGSGPDQSYPSYPHHLKSPYTSCDDILAEVVQVKRGHDRVLDQLNLDVENLLLRSTDEIENHNYSNVSSVIGNCKLAQNSWPHQHSRSMDSGGGLNRPQCDGGPKYSNTIGDGVTDEGNGCELEDGGRYGFQNYPGPPFISHKKSKSETCADCCLKTDAGDKSTKGSGTFGFGGIPGLGTFGRKKKLDRNGINSVPLEGSKKNEGNVNCQNGIPGDGGNRNNKTGRQYRSYSLIPGWKLRDHLLRLPFLKNYGGGSDKLKKTESLSGGGTGIEDCNTQQIFGSKPSSGVRQNNNNKYNNNNTNNQSQGVPSTTAGFLLPTSISSYTLQQKKKKKKKKGKKGGNWEIHEEDPKMATTMKARSSSMDELRTSGGQEEHWYSADSDTEPDPFPLPSPTTQLPLSTGNGIISINSGGLLSSPLTSSSEHSTSRLEMSTIPSTPAPPSVPDHIPKAPKFRRGSGIKDKWRESWIQSKSTLNKTSNMEDENRLLRWFSLRKSHHGGSTTTVDGGSVGGTSGGGGSGGSGGIITNRNSTLPLLSEDDLKRLSFMEDEEGYWPRRTVLPPTLPVPPVDLTPEQITRRHIIAAIVHSENNYVSALQRLVNEYKKPLECSHPVMLSHSKISTVFHRVPEILQCHSLFRIALAEYIRKWDSDEKIGDVFVASFSKSLVLDVYSEFINNFGQAMETAKAEARRKSTFAEFLKVKQMTAHDRLSLFGLMVKPVQRFPQFILLLQDLLKHTPKDHHDRMSLQLALTQLESLAAMLNERKRESEQYQAFRETIKSISGGKFVLLRSIADDPNRILLRQDLATQLEFDSSGGQVAKSKTRKLLLLNDMLICVTTTGPNGNSTSSTERTSRRNSQPVQPPTTAQLGTKTEKSIFKWSYPVREVEIEDISISPTMSRYVSVGNVGSRGGLVKGIEASPVSDEANQESMSLLEEMQSLMHDYSVLSRISELIKTLKSSYEGLTESLVKEIMLEIQHQIRCRDEQISFFDSSCLTLLLGTGSNRERVVFQLQSPQARNEWIEELRLAQLALDPNNSPGWDIPPETPYPHHQLPLFVRSLPVCRSPHLNTVKAGCFFTHTTVSQTGRSKIQDYLWVSCTDGFSSHITAYRSQQNILKEISSFDLMEEKINDLIFVAGHVWMATESRKLLVFDPSDTDKGILSQCLLSDSVLRLTHFQNVIYAGLADGMLAIFTDLQLNPKFLEPHKLIKLGPDRIISVFGARDHVYAACKNSVVSIDTRTHTVERNVVLTHHNGPITHMACSGVGLWISTQDSGTVCLYHLESLQHLQDVSIAPSVYRTVRDSYRRQKGCHVTCLQAHKGWLWIGTNLGVVLTIPLPRLEGVPIISTGKANVSYHGFYGSVTFLMPLIKSPPPTIPSVPNGTATRLKTPSASPSKSSEISSHLKTPNSTNLLTGEEDFQARTPSNVTFDEKETTLVNGKTSSTSTSPSLSASSSFNESKPGSSTGSPLQSIASGLGSRMTGNDPLLPSLGGLNKSLVILRKKNSRENALSRNCKTLPRTGPFPLNLRISVDSDVYGLYGNLINVRGLEDEGRFVDPLYDALRRSDPELVALDAKINTLDRRLKMRMSRPRSLDLSNWSVDSKISASSDESVGAGGSGSRSSQATDTNLLSPILDSSVPITPIESTVVASSGNITLVQSPGTGTNKKGSTATGRTKARAGKGPGGERTVILVIGGRGYVNMKSQNHQDHFINSAEAEGKQCTHLTVWQVKT